MMTAKEIFQEAYLAQRELRRLEQRRQHYIAMATSMSGMSETHIRSTEVRSRTETAALGLVEIADQISGQMERYAKYVRRAEEIIQKLEKPRHRELLSLHYLQGHNWSTVSGLMGYRDPKSVFRVHGWALLAAQKVLQGNL